MVINSVESTLAAYVPIANDGNRLCARVAISSTPSILSTYSRTPHTENSTGIKASSNSSGTSLYIPITDGAGLVRTSSSDSDGTINWSQALFMRPPSQIPVHYWGSTWAFVTCGDRLHKMFDDLTAGGSDNGKRAEQDAGGDTDWPVSMIGDATALATYHWGKLYAATDRGYIYVISFDLPTTLDGGASGNESVDSGYPIMIPGGAANYFRLITTSSGPGFYFTTNDGRIGRLPIQN
jgi:hypothetical protein